jgi:outer membrane protein, heavy metal efflux system
VPFVRLHPGSLRFLLPTLLPIPLLGLNACQQPRAEVETSTAASPALAAASLKASTVSFSKEGLGPATSLDVPFQPLADLSSLQDAAAQQNYAILAARLKADAAHSAIGAAAGYPDPTLKIGGFLQPLETRNGPTQAKLSLQQPLPWSKTLHAIEDVAKADARTADASVLVMQRRVRRQCAELWWELAYVHEAVEILEQNLELLDSTHAVVSSRLEVGAARLPELLRVEMEAVQLRDRQRQLRDRLTPLRTRLNGLLGLTTSTASWQKPVLPDAEQWSAMTEFDLQGAADGSALFEGNPELTALSAAAEGRRARWQQSQSAERPQWGIGVDWTMVGDGNALSPDSGEDAIALMVSVQLPLHRGRDQARTAQAHAEWQMAEQAKREREVRLQSEWQQIRFEMANSIATVNLLQQELSTRVNSALQTELAAFETGDAAFEGLLESLRLLLDFQLRNAQAQKQIMQGAAQLDELAGGLVSVGEGR